MSIKEIKAPSTLTCVGKSFCKIYNHSHMSNHWVEGALSYYTAVKSGKYTHKKNTGMQKQNVLPTCMHQGHASFQLPNMERNHLNPLFSLNPPDSNSFWSILLLFQFIPLLFQPFLVLFWPVSASLWVIPSHPASFHSVPAFSNTHPFPQVLHFTNSAFL